MQKWLYIGMMWICGLCSALSAGQQTQSRFTILGLGDSITEGATISPATSIRCSSIVSRSMRPFMRFVG